MVFLFISFHCKYRLFLAFGLKSRENRILELKDSTVCKELAGFFERLRDFILVIAPSAIFFLNTAIILCGISYTLITVTFLYGDSPSLCTFIRKGCRWIIVYTLYLMKCPLPVISQTYTITQPP